MPVELMEDAELQEHGHTKRDSDLAGLRTFLDSCTQRAGSAETARNSATGECMTDLGF